MTITGFQLIGFSKSGKSRKTFKSIGAEEEKSGVFYEASDEEIDEAVQKASDVFDDFRMFPIAKKAAFLEKIAQNIDSGRKLLAEIAGRETALPAGRLDGEINRTVNQIKLFATLLKEGSWVKAIIDTSEPARLPLPKPDIRQMQLPIGVVGVFGASNFPFAFSVAGGDTISALAAGCPVVYKAHPGHPATSELVGEMIIQAAKDTDMPDGVFSLIQGATYHTGLRLVNHALIKAIAFTGSFSGGKALYDAAAKRPEPIPVFAEMGSVNPVFILPEILAEKGAEVAKSLAASNTLSAGQFCTNPGIIVSGDSANTGSFLNEFAGSIRSTPGAAMLTESIYQGYNKGIKALTGSSHVSVVASADEEKEGTARAHMFRVEATDFLEQEKLWEEVFGPESIHVIAKGTEQMLEIARAMPGQITVSVWGTANDFINNKKLLQLLELKAGRIISNTVPTGVEVTAAMVHGGPYPATTDSKYTSVGTQAIYRFTRPVCYQNYPEQSLPEALQNNNPLKIWRMVNSVYDKGEIS